METKTLIREEVNREIEELGRLPLGKEEYKLTVDGATKLTDRLIELEKIEIEADARERDREIDTEIKLKQIDDEITANQRIIAGNAQFAGIAAGRGVRFTTGLLLLGKGLGMRETPIRPHSWH